MGSYTKDEQTHWLIGWEWHAHMWYVTAPEEMDPQPETVWFTTRDEALEYVDEQILRAPVPYSIVDETAPPAVERPGQDEAITIAAARLRHAEESYVPEPVRTFNQQVDDPNVPDHLRAYAQMVGFQ